MPTENDMVLVGINRETASWLGMAPKVAGGCVATSDAARYAAEAAGYDYLALLPASWLPDVDYKPLSEERKKAAVKELTFKSKGWSGAARLNAEREAALDMLRLM